MVHGLKKRTAEQLLSDKEKRVKEIAEHNEWMLKNRPEGHKFYSYALKNDEQWRILSSLPSEEFINQQKNAMRWGTRMIYVGLKGAVITGMFYNSRVVEFEYVHVIDSDGKITLYDPIA